MTKWGKVIFYSVLLATGLVFLFCPSCFQSLEGIKNSLDNIFFSFILCILLGYGNGELITIIDRKISWIEAPVKRLIVGTIVVVVYSFLASVLVVYLYNIFLYDRPPFDSHTWRQTINAAILPVYIAIVITVILTSRSFLLAWKKSTIDTEKLKRENLQAQYNALKNQINPHFLFNSFNVLTDLVYMDQDLAAKFIQRLSVVFRYVLDSSKKEFVSLKSELDFLDSYIFLLKIRFGENLLIERPEYEDKGENIIPLCLQMLIENAVKHNVVSEEEQLKIVVKIEDDQVCVSNNIQLRNVTEGSTKLGLANIKARYALLNGKSVKVEQTKENFTVYVPLISAV